MRPIHRAGRCPRTSTPQPSSSKTFSKIGGYLSIFAGASLFGIGGMVAKYLSNREVDPLIIVEARLLLGALLTGLILLVSDRRLLVVRRSDLPYLILLGIVGMAGVQASYYFTITQTTVATAVFLQFLAPVPIAVYSSLVSRESMRPAVRNAAFVAVLGSGLLLLGRQGRVVITPIGLLTGLSSAFFLSFYTIWGKKRAGVIPPWTMLLYSLIFGAVAFSLVRSPLTIIRSGFDRSEWAVLLYTITFGTVIPFGLYFFGLRALTATETSVVGTLEPVVASLAAFIVLGEVLTSIQIVGAVLITAAIAYLQSVPATTGRPARAEGGSP
ncbi:MAG TPA: DMT family transporter [Bacillota bacterium]|jgi:drug/metabolite transporter (DMT)-like permease